MFIRVSVSGPTAARHSNHNAVPKSSKIVHGPHCKCPLLHTILPQQIAQGSIPRFLIITNQNHFDAFSAGTLMLSACPVCSAQAGPPDTRRSFKRCAWPTLPRLHRLQRPIKGDQIFVSQSHHLPGTPHSARGGMPHGHVLCKRSMLQQNCRPDETT